MNLTFAHFTYAFFIRCLIWLLILLFHVEPLLFPLIYTALVRLQICKLIDLDGVKC